MKFSPDIKINALVACGRCCCICHKFCGTKMQIHHIIQDSDGGEGTFDNAIPLCLDCHVDVNTYNDKHPVGTKYKPKELKRHRDAWYSKMQTSNATHLDADDKATDIDLFLNLLKVLPPLGIIDYLRQCNYTGFPSWYDTEIPNGLKEFCYEWDSAMHEFIDPDLESLKATLYSEINAFLMIVANETFPDRNKGQSVPYEWEMTDPERYKTTINKIHTAGKNVCKVYDDLIRTGRKKLGITLTDLKKLSIQ